MRRWVPLFLLALVVLQGAGSVIAQSRDERRRGAMRRTLVVVQRDWPLRRPLRHVVDRPAGFALRLTTVSYLPVATWKGDRVEPPPPRERLSLQGVETLLKDESWTAFRLNCERAGARLWLEVETGRIQFDWAEVLFESGEARVVDMREYARGPGHYELLDLGDTLGVSHVRFVARARTNQARLVMKMEQ